MKLIHTEKDRHQQWDPAGTLHKPSPSHSVRGSSVMKATDVTGAITPSRNFISVET